MPLHQLIETTETSVPTEFFPTSDVSAREARFISLACPWTSVCGGMVKVVDDRIQSQGQHSAEIAAALRPPATLATGGIARGLLKVLINMLERDGKARDESPFSLVQFCTSIAKIHQRHFGICNPGSVQKNPSAPKRVE